MRRGTSEDQEGPKADGERKDDARPRLTERQRIEARKARQARRRRPARGANPLSRGLRATGFEIRRTASFIGGAIIAALGSLGPVFSSAGMGLVWLLEQAGRGLKALDRLLRGWIAAAGRLARALDRAFSPHRAAILIAAVAAVLLGVSQYQGLGQIEIGQPGYAGIEDLARAPAIDRTTPAGVHTRILVPIAAIAFLAVLVIALAGSRSFAARLGRLRRFAAMVLVTIGLLAIAVALLVDLPEATDTTEAALAYAGVRAVLLTGFWVELAAGAALAVSGLTLLLPPVRPGANARGEREESRRRRREPRVAGSSPVSGSRA